MSDYNKNHPESIRKLFNSIAKNYDKTNEVLSFRMNKRWNQELINEILKAVKPKKFLDLCCGTGAIALTYLKDVSESLNVYMLDFSEEMLLQAKAEANALKLDQHQIVYLQADARKIPLNSSEVECVTLAYGIRNIQDPQDCIKEVYRILEPGGRFGILELTQPTNSFMRMGHRFYLRAMVPLVGKLLTSNKQAYQYLRNSINTFISSEELEALLQNEGFINIDKKSFFAGVATLFTATKPV
jgi:demethylmenaquinone methyltransferase / 2-methoxy-6-polyprenyl-1,4-benzoquinol methylase